jgi:hypothetical protein
MSIDLVTASGAAVVHVDRGAMCPALAALARCGDNDGGRHDRYIGG